MEALIDLRGLPVWERPSRVLDRFDRLAPGETLTFVTENEPRGLSARIEESRKHELIVDPRRVGESEWHVLLTRARLNGESPAAVGVLHRTVAFNELPENVLSQLAAASSMHAMRRGQVVHAENIEWPFIGVAFEGAFALSNAADHGRHRLYYEIFPYEVFGEAEFFDESPTLGRVIVLSKTARYIRIPLAELRAVGKQYPQLVLGLGRALAQRSRDALTSLARQTTMPILARVAQVLLPYAVPEKGLAKAVSPLPNMTQSQIAAAAGTVKEVAARAIAELERMELIKRERGHVCYLDRQALADYVRSQS